MRLTTAATVALMFGTLPIFVALVAQAFGLERLHAAPLARAARLLRRRRAGRGRERRAVCRRPRRHPARPGGAAITWAATRSRSRRSCGATRPTGSARSCCSRARSPLLLVGRQAARRAGLGRRSAARVGVLRLQPLLLARLHEHHVVHGDRPGRGGPRVALREPAAVPRGLLRARHLWRRRSVPCRWSAAW